MAWTRMSERDIKRVEVLNEVQSGRRTVAAAASVLGISERQGYRLLSRYQENGGFGLVHKARGRTSNRSHNRRCPGSSRSSWSRPTTRTSGRRWRREASSRRGYERRHKKRRILYESRLRRDAAAVDDGLMESVAEGTDLGSRNAQAAQKTALHQPEAVLAPTSLIRVRFPLRF